MIVLENLKYLIEKLDNSEGIEDFVNVQQIFNNLMNKNLN